MRHLVEVYSVRNVPQLSFTLFYAFTVTLPQLSVRLHAARPNPNAHRLIFPPSPHIP